MLSWQKELFSLCGGLGVFLRVRIGGLGVFSRGGMMVMVIGVCALFICLLL